MAIYDTILDMTGNDTF